MVDNNEGQRFDFEITTLTDGYVGIDFYNARMYPSGCKLDAKGAY